jgi:hypothetical protein
MQTDLSEGFMEESVEVSRAMIHISKCYTDWLDIRKMMSDIHKYTDCTLIA